MVMSERLEVIKDQVCRGSYMALADDKWLVAEVERLEKECIRWQARAEAAEHNFKSTLELLAKRGRGDV